MISCSVIPDFAVFVIPNALRNLSELVRKVNR